MNKRGLSGIVTTIIIILLVLVAISIMWIVVKNLISKQTEISEAQTKLLSERVDIKKVLFDPENELEITLAVQKLGGSSVWKTVELEVPPMEVDVISVADLSGSMRDCYGYYVSWSCCVNTLGGNSSGAHCYGISSENLDECVSTCGGTLIDGLTPTQGGNEELINTLFVGENNNRLGLVAYATVLEGGFSLELTDNTETLRNMVNSWESGGSTCICCGINDAIDKLEDSSDETTKTIIVMSDGEATRGCTGNNNGAISKQEAIDKACEAYGTLENLKIYTVGLGGNVDDATLTAIAIPPNPEECGGDEGQYFSAENMSDLIEVYVAVGGEIVRDYEASHLFNYLKIVFYDESNSISRNIPIPKALGTEEQTFDLSDSGLTPPIIKIEIYPVITTDSKEIIGAALDIWEA